MYIPKDGTTDPSTDPSSLWLSLKPLTLFSILVTHTWTTAQARPDELLKGKEKGLKCEEETDGGRTERLLGEAEGRGRLQRDELLPD